ncbi:alanyl-tRNA editing protein [Rhodobacter calidifons]|uniref:Alanyl-tRNA editing protein n=1 Tax=Rhodobacter calidifons TaxID=2715277 RepID=A0ABX0GAL0_9RHOB|nr:alanyl-tRNA editing protein [Rhodobacter calidifons]NHB78332.1 alanyl-tRNA editing protein [Rhodobacter calidifons]
MTTELLFRDDAYLTAADCRIIGHTPEGGLIVDRSVFYPTGGGQPGDSGVLDWGGTRMPIATALKVEGGIALIPAEPAPMPPVGAPARQQIDWGRRYRHMRVHTALHLLSVVLPFPVTGGQIAADRGRLDFAMPEPPGAVSALEEALNALIRRDLTVSDDWISDDALLANPGLVKTMSVRPPLGQGRVRLVRIADGETQIDLQPCGGTHVRRTAEVGQIKIGKIESKGRQNRRVSLQLA